MSRSSSLRLRREAKFTLTPSATPLRLSQFSFGASFSRRWPLLAPIYVLAGPFVVERWAEEENEGREAGRVGEIQEGQGARRGRPRSRRAMPMRLFFFSLR